MKKSLLLASLALAMSACAPLALTPSPSASASAPAATPSTSDQIIQAQLDVTSARKAFLALMEAKKITVAQDQSVEAALNVISANLATAQTLLPSNPAQAASLLATALQALAAFQGVSQ